MHLFYPVLWLPQGGNAQSLFLHLARLLFSLSRTQYFIQAQKCLCLLAYYISLLWCFSFCVDKCSAFVIYSNGLWYCDMNQNNSCTFSCLIRFWHLAGGSYKSSWTRQIAVSAVYCLAVEWIEVLRSAMHGLVIYNLLNNGSCFRCFYWSVTYLKHLHVYYIHISM